MSVVLDKESESWTTPAGWGIWADLTPPELLVALVALVVLVIAVYGLLMVRSHEATDAVTAQQTRTSALEAQELQYGSVTQIKGTVAQVQSQLSQLMVGDVEVAPLLRSVAAVWPRTITITGEQVTLSGAAAAAAGTSLDTTDTPQIGKVSLTGDAPTLNAFAGYLAALQTVRGMTDVSPGSTGITPTGISFTVTMSITDVLLSHRYDLTSTAAAATAAATPATTPSVSP
jgi:hypothetical protein